MPSMKSRVGLAPRDLEEVDDLGDRERVGGRAHLVAEGLEAGDVAVVGEAEERSAGHVADPRGLEDDHAGAAAGVAEVDLAHRVGDEAILGAAPGDHRRKPDPVGHHEPPPSDGEGLEQQRVRAAGGQGVRDQSLLFQSSLSCSSARSSSAVSSSRPWSARRRRRTSKLVRSGGLPVAIGLEDLLEAVHPTRELADRLERQGGPPLDSLLEGRLAAELPQHVDESGAQAVGGVDQLSQQEAVADEAHGVFDVLLAPVASQAIPAVRREDEPLGPFLGFSGDLAAEIDDPSHVTRSNRRRPEAPCGASADRESGVRRPARRVGCPRRSPSCSPPSRAS